MEVHLEASHSADEVDGFVATSDDVSNDSRYLLGPVHLLLLYLVNVGQVGFSWNTDMSKETPGMWWQVVSAAFRWLLF